MSDKCSDCAGEGRVPGTPRGAANLCPSCAGSGYVPTICPPHQGDPCVYCGEGVTKRAIEIYEVYRAELANHPNGPTVVPEFEDISLAERDSWRSVAIFTGRKS